MVKPFCLVLFFSVLSFFPESQLEISGWQREKSRHFIIYHQDAPAHYLNRLVSKAENHYRKITNKFGFQRFDFWLWDDRCRIFLYPDSQTYRETTGSTSWSRAHVDLIEKK